MMFILISDYLRPTDEVDAQLTSHRTWIKRGYDAGQILFSGRLVPPTGGAIVLRAGSREEVADLIATDPYVQHGLVRYEIHEVAETPFPHRSQAFDDFMNSPYDQASAATDAE